MKNKFSRILISFFIIFQSCNNVNTSKFWEDFDYGKAPKGFPMIPFPSDNPYTPSKERLGRYLFFDKILSKDFTYSCASCHNPRYAFSNNVPNPLTINKFPLARNVVSLVNVAYRNKLGWSGVEEKLEDAIYSDFHSPLFLTMTRMKFFVG